MYKILLTAIGCPNGITAIKNLQRYGVDVVGADARSNPIAASFVERFYQVPLASSADFIDTIADIVRREKPDVLVSQSEEEVAVLSRHGHHVGTCVMVTSPKAVHESMNKVLAYRKAKHLGVPIPRYFHAMGPGALLRDVRACIAEFGSAIIRPTRGKGSRGLLVVVPILDRASNNWQVWPDATLISVNELESSSLTNLRYPLIVSEPLVGEMAYEGYCVDGKILTGFLKRKTRMINNSTHTHNVSIEDEAIESIARAMVADFGGHSFVDVQCIGGKLMEINPRLSTLIYTPDYNMIHFGILHTLGLMSDAEIAEKRLPPGKTAEFYWGVHYA